MTRSEVQGLSDLELLVRTDGLRGDLERAWRHGEPGSLAAVYDLGLCYGEAAIRGVRLACRVPEGWMILFDIDAL